MKVSRFDSSENNVLKYVFEFSDAIAEAVLYKYDCFYKRTVLCVSVQSGCPVGCTFCGTGSKFIRNLSADEIITQVKYCLGNMDIEDVDEKGERFQIMFMSMGEPMLNIKNVERAIRLLNIDYPNTELLISTIGVEDKEATERIFKLSEDIDKVGLQFSIHEACEEKRDKLIPYRNKLSLRKLRDFGLAWNESTDRPVYLNYCVHENNQSPEELERLKDLFSPLCFNFTFSVICSSDENMKEKGYKELSRINKISQNFIEEGYNVRVFDPAGQDDIGGGCGQLWFTQDWMKRRKENNG